MLKNYEYIHALYVAYGSNCELATQIQLSCDLGYVETEHVKGLQGSVKEVERMLKALLSTL